MKEADGQLVVQAIPKSRPKTTASAKPMRRRPAPITPPRRPRVPPPPPPMPPAAHDVPPEFGGAATEQQAEPAPDLEGAAPEPAEQEFEAGQEETEQAIKAEQEFKAAQLAKESQTVKAAQQLAKKKEESKTKQAIKAEQEFKARQLAEEESEIEQEEFKAWQLAQQELKATAEGHPECMQCEDCVGSRASLLLRNYIKDTVSGLHCEGDVYCWECFDCFRTHLPNGHNMVFIK